MPIFAYQKIMISILIQEYYDNRDEFEYVGIIDQEYN